MRAIALGSRAAHSACIAAILSGADECCRRVDRSIVRVCVCSSSEWQRPSPLRPLASPLFVPLLPLFALLRVITIVSVTAQGDESSNAGSAMMTTMAPPEWDLSSQPFDEPGACSSERAHTQAALLANRSAALRLQRRLASCWNREERMRIQTRLGRHVYEGSGWKGRNSLERNRRRASRATRTARLGCRAER